MCVCYVVSNAHTILEAPGELKRVEVEILVLKEYTVFSETACAYFKMDKKMGLLFYSLSCYIVNTEKASTRNPCRPSQASLQLFRVCAKR